MQVTVKQLAARLNVEYPTAAALIKLMIAKGVAKEVGKQASVSTTGKGKPSTIYEVPQEFTVSLMPSQANAA